MKKGKFNKPLKLMLQGAPLAGALGASLLPIRQLGHQFLVLVTLVWVQIFLIVECFLAGK
jgi:hypothetical protein